MPADTPLSPPPSQQAVDIGRAGRALRERAGMTQDDVADAMGVRRQAIQNYEQGARQSVLRTDLQDRWAKAMGVAREDLLREVARQAGQASPLERWPVGDFPPANDQTYELAVVTRSRPGEDGPTLYGVAEPDTVIDMSWMFGANARTLRMAGDRMSGYVESGQLVVYDVSVWPKRGDGCVVELTNGEAIVAEYVESGQGVLKVKFRQGGEEKGYPMAEVRGAYIIRFRGS